MSASNSGRSFSAFCAECILDLVQCDAHECEEEDERRCHEDNENTVEEKIDRLVDCGL